MRLLSPTWRRSYGASAMYQYEYSHVVQWTCRECIGGRSGLPLACDFCSHRVWAYSPVCFGFCCYCPSDSAKFPVVIFPFAHAAILLVTPWYFFSVFCLAKFPFGHVAILLVTSWYFQSYFRLVPVPEAAWARRTPAPRNETLPRNTTTSGW